MRYLQMWLVIPLTLLVSSPVAAQYARRQVAGGYAANHQPPAMYAQSPAAYGQPPLLSDAPAPPGVSSAIDANGIPFDQSGIPLDESGVPLDESGYPLVDGTMDPTGMGFGCGDEVGGCGEGACADGSCGSSHRLWRQGRIAAWFNHACQCAAVRPYILPIGRRDCYGCPQSTCGPYGDGTSAVHWFDVSAEYVSLTRDDVSNVDFASDGVSGPIVLSSDDVDFGNASGVRLTGTWQIGAAAHLEAVYMGSFNWHENALVTSDNDNLYSVFSDFGNLPAGGFLQTDQAVAQYLDYSSDLNNIELNWRQHWVGSTYWFQGSFLMGVRYLRLREDLAYVTRVEDHVDPLTTLDRGPASMNYRVNTTNHVVGFQLGGDLFASLLPGLLVGGEVKAGIYGNDARARTTVVATNLNPDVQESDRSGDVAFVAEGGLTVVYQIQPWLSLRGGYEVLFVNGVALAPENFNTQAPFAGPRSVAIDNDGDAVYNGFTAGIEWLW